MSLSNLHTRLSGDRWRIKHPFSRDILEANALLHNPAANEPEMARCLTQWCQHCQPCQFGRIAARDRRLHFCVLREPQILGWTDEEISDAIRESKRTWKQRAAYDPSRAAHSFILVFASPMLAFAATDSCLRDFADHALRLTGWANESQSSHRKNFVATDYLYLRKPSTDEFFGYRFNIDFFASAGDRSWWHDHRFPGGITFTANSTGHMRAYREWYRPNPEGTENWALRQAMLTIANAAPTAEFENSGHIPREEAAEGRATWLRPLEDNGLPFISDVKIPLSKMPQSLVGKDWTRYEGVLHTDHAVREEFFLDRDTPVTNSRPYLQDFTYLYDQTQPDFAEFTAGIPVPEQRILAEVGSKDTWISRADTAQSVRTPEEELIISKQIAACGRWRDASPLRELDDAD